MENNWIISRKRFYLDEAIALSKQLLKKGIRTRFDDLALAFCNEDGEIIMVKVSIIWEQKKPLPDFINNLDIF